jgi:hypothetical protein
MKMMNAECGMMNARRIGLFLFITHHSSFIIPKSFITHHSSLKKGGPMSTKMKFQIYGLMFAIGLCLAGNDGAYFPFLNMAWGGIGAGRLEGRII